MRARVTVTVPQDLLDAADRRAAELDRSRSRIVADALRAYLSEERQGSLVREPATRYGTGLGASRQAQLEADLALSPEERVRAAEETAALARRLERRPVQRGRVIAFERLEDYFAWERRESIDL